MSEGTFNPTDRRLCPDGSCIGLLGPDGRCRVCGRAGDGAPIGVGVGVAAPPAWDVADDDDAHAHTHADDSFSTDADSTAGAGAFRPDRRLCDDGSCVGVIGAGDVCSVCGRPAAS